MTTTMKTSDLKSNRILKILLKSIQEKEGNQDTAFELTCDRLWYALPSKLDHHATLRYVFDRDFDRWQSEAYFHLFECFRAIGLEVEATTHKQWDTMNEADRNQAVFFVFEGETLLSNENPDFISWIKTDEMFLTRHDIEIGKDLKEALAEKYTETQRQSAKFDQLYINLSSLIHYITQHYTTRTPERRSERDIIATEAQTKRVNLLIMDKKLKSIHSFWEFCKKANSSLKHPLAPIVRAWMQEQIPKVPPARRNDTGILHDKIKNTFPSPRLPLTTAETVPAKPEQLMLINNLPQEKLQLELPGLVFPETELVPALPLVAYENAGGNPVQRGRGAPIEQRLFVNVLVEYEQRQRGQHDLSRLYTTYRDVKSWLYPNGSTDSKKVLIPRLRQGLWNLHNLRFIWERREWNIIAVDTLPTMDIKPNDPLTFTTRMPPGMNTSNGALISIEPLRLYGAQSAPKFRAWVRLAYLWDAAKMRNGGNRIYATIPEVLRNSDSYLVDAKGEVTLTGNLYRTKHGWKFRNGNMPQTAWYHPLAIQTGGTERNPQADKVPILSDADMVKLFYDHTERKGSLFRECLRIAKQHAHDIQENGRIVIETDQTDQKTGVTGWRILEPHSETM